MRWLRRQEAPAPEPEAMLPTAPLARSIVLEGCRVVRAPAAELTSDGSTLIHVSRLIRAGALSVYGCCVHVDRERVLIHAPGNLR